MKEARDDFRQKPLGVTCDPVKQNEGGKIVETVRNQGDIL
jgi:hypothetical protein